GHQVLRLGDDDLLDLGAVEREVRPRAAADLENASLRLTQKLLPALPEAVLLGPGHAAVVVGREKPRPETHARSLTNSRALHGDDDLRPRVAGAEIRHRLRKVRKRV